MVNIKTCLKNLKISGDLFTFSLLDIVVAGELTWVPYILLLVLDLI